MKQETNIHTITKSQVLLSPITGDIQQIIDYANIELQSDLDHVIDELGGFVHFKEHCNDD